MRIPVIFLGVALVGSAVVAACGGEVDTPFGPPNGIVGRSAPQPGNPGGSSGSGSGSSSGSSSGSGSGSGSSSGGSGSGSGSGGDAGSGSGGGDAGDGGQMTQNCTVSWKTQVFPLFMSTGPGQCASAACHGGTNPPTIADNDPATSLQNLQKYTINGKQYVATGSTDPAGSSIECNLGMVTPVCGLAQMPEAPGALDAAQRTTIDTWVKCGAPNN